MDKPNRNGRVCVLKVPMTDVSVCLGGEQLWLPCGLFGTDKAAQSVSDE